MGCPHCQHENPGDFRYCGGCGARLASSAPPASPERARSRGERRQLTVMFCDLAKSTELSEKLDPEDLCDVIEAYREACGAAVDRFGGHVAQYLGDGILAYFSFPFAHEDDAERAVRAGLEVHSNLADLNPHLEKRYGVQVSARVSVHTGPVVIDRSRHQRETLALGRAVNVAKRVSEIALPGTVVMTRDTHRLVEGLFVTRNLGAHALRGVADPIELDRVLAASSARGRLDASLAKGLTPLVGREREIDSLVQAFDTASRGRGRVVFLGGDPGIGKSRLVHALQRRVAVLPHGWLECRGSPHHQNSAFHPVIEALRRVFAFGPGDSAARRAALVEEGLDRAGIDPAEALPLLAELLSIEVPGAAGLRETSPEARRRRTLDVLARWIFTAAKSRPLVLAMEDLHWFDPSTLELFDRIVKDAAAASMLVLATHRSSFVLRWPVEGHASRLGLGPLGRDESARLVEAVARGSDVAPELLEQIVERTDGVPLYAEEITKSVLEESLSREAGANPSADGVRIPPTLRDSLAGRLDRLGSAKDVAQLAAILGRDFSAAQLEAASTLDRTGIRRALAELEDAGFLTRRESPSGDAYAFRHALIHEVAYESLLRRTRRAWHARVARALEKHFAEEVAEEPEGVARHFEEGGLAPEAVDYYERAGQRATGHSANVEAIGHFERAIALLDRLPKGRERDECELRLQLALAGPLVATTGWGSHEAERTHLRALALGERAEDASQRFQLMRRVITFHVSRAELGQAHELCSELHELAERERDSSLLLLAEQQEAIVLYYLGRPTEALARYERAVSLHDPERHAALLHLHGEDLGVFTRLWMHWALWIAGFPDRALARSDEAIAMAREIHHPFSEVYAQVWAAVLRLLRREREQAHELAGAAAELAVENGFAFHIGASRALEALAKIDPEQPTSVVDSAIADFQAAMADAARTGTEVTRPKILGMLAEALASVGRIAPAEAIVAAAIASAERTGQPFWNAELARIRGKLALAKDASEIDTAERHFRAALAIAERQRANALALRAATDLAILLGESGRREEARAVLEPSYRGFDEGLDLADLETARGLLRALE